MNKPVKIPLKELKAEVDAEQANIPVITSWEKIDDPETPVWYVIIQGSNKKMTIKDARDITDYRRFATQCFKQLNMIFPPVKPVTWANILRDAPKLTVVQADKDTTREGEFRELLGTFLTNRMRGKSRVDILRGAPWEDEERGRHYFTMESLAKYLKREGVRMERSETAAWIRVLGGNDRDDPNPTLVAIKKGVGRRCWWVSSDAIDRAPELDTPDMPVETL